jgi:hypothetical protein
MAAMMARARHARRPHLRQRVEKGFLVPGADVIRDLHGDRPRLGLGLLGDEEVVPR